VLELEFRDGSNRYDGVRPEAHPHLICTRCGKIEDLELPGLEDLPRRVAEQSGYRINSYRCDLFGLCRECQ
jgi:Fur family transcriptional regulator, peroxide stress response regulator